MSSVNKHANSLDNDQTLWNFPPDLNKKNLKKLILEKYLQTIKKHEEK